MKRNRFLAVTLSATVLGGGTISAPAIMEAMVPTYGVTVQSASIKKTTRDMGDFKAGTKYCSLYVKHRNSNVKANIPAPAQTCALVKKGQELTVRADRVVSGIKF